MLWGPFTRLLQMGFFYLCHPISSFPLFISSLDLRLQLPQFRRPLPISGTSVYGMTFLPGLFPQVKYDVITFWLRGKTATVCFQLMVLSLFQWNFRRNKVVHSTNLSCTKNSWHTAGLEFSSLLETVFQSKHSPSELAGSAQIEF